MSTNEDLVYQRWDEHERCHIAECSGCGSVIAEGMITAHVEFHDRLDRLEATAARNDTTGTRP